MAWSLWIATSEDVPLDRLESVLRFRGYDPSIYDPEPLQRSPEGLTQPLGAGQLTVSSQPLDTVAVSRRVAITAKLRRPPRSLLRVDYDNPTLDADDSREAHRVCFVWLRVMSEVFGWPAVLGLEDHNGKFQLFTARES
jgi:hypothetical protein